MTIRVHLLQDVKGLGRKGDLVAVADGYARNYLLPKKLAEVATPQVLARIEAERRKHAQKHIEHVASFEVLHAKLQSAVLSFTGKTNPQGHLYASIGAQQIADEIKRRFGLTVAADRIRIPKPIKAVGEHPVDIAFKNGKMARGMISVKSI